MKIIELEQGTPEWKKWRNEGIGASDIAVIMGTNPYKTPYQLWEEKCGFSKPKELSEAMLHGIKNEDMVRKGLNFDKSINLKPICIEDPANSFIKASLDGWDGEKGLLYEIKCPISHLTIEKALKGHIHAYWIDQVQWQIMISKPKQAFIALWDWENCQTITVEIKEHKARQGEMLRKASEFWDHIVKGTTPTLTDKDYIEIKDPQLEELALKYIEVDDQEKKLKSEKKELKNQIVEFGDDGNFCAYGLKVKRCHPSIRYDMAKMKEDGIDVNKYKKVSTSIGYYRISISSENFK